MHNRRRVCARTMAICRPPWKSSRRPPLERASAQMRQVFYISCNFLPRPRSRDPRDDGRSFPYTIITKRSSDETFLFPSTSCASFTLVIYVIVNRTVFDVNCYSLKAGLLDVMELGGKKFLSVQGDSLNCNWRR